MPQTCREGGGIVPCSPPWLIWGALVIQGCPSLGAKWDRTSQCSLDPGRLNLVCPALQQWNGFFVPAVENPCSLAPPAILPLALSARGWWDPRSGGRGVTWGQT